MLGPGTRREWPGCSKPAFRKEPKNRRDLAEAVEELCSEEVLVSGFTMSGLFYFHLGREGTEVWGYARAILKSGAGARVITH